MSWVEWLKGLTERASGKPQSAPRKSPAVRLPRKGGEAYAKEWVKVLEDSNQQPDPTSTYTWELNEDKAARPQKDPRRRKRADAPNDPFDSFTWEVPETDSRDDPWGLKKDKESAAKKTARRDGANPYDTGVFKANWTGRFDQR